MKKIVNIPYDATIGDAGLGDLFIPESSTNCPAALLIHGGAWKWMDKESITPVAIALVDAGYAVFNVNYRLIDTAPWPACGNDCLNAATFLLNAGYPEMAHFNLTKISIVGASAGGHLALMTGLQMPSDKINAIMDISGISDVNLFRKQFNIDDPSFWPTFAGGEVTEAILKDASPRYYVTNNSPQLCCIHSTNDQLVSPEHCNIMKQAYDCAGATCETIFYDGPGKSHGLFEDGHGELALADRILVPCVKEAIINYFKNLN